MRVTGILALLVVALPACSSRRMPPPVQVWTPPTVARPPSTPVATPAARPASTPASTLDVDDPEALWTRLLEGNARFRSGRALHPRQDVSRRRELATKQAPKVVVLACADSRVAPEVLFDQGLGDLFVLRVAGNVVTPDVEASIEYAVEHLGSRLIVVLGHERCGAVAAAIEGGTAPGHLPGLLARIAPAVAATPEEGPDRPLRVATTHAALTADALRHNEVLEEASTHHPVLVRAAVLDLDTGEVTAVASRS